MPASVGSPRPQSRPISIIGSPTSATQRSPSQPSPRSPFSAMQNIGSPLSAGRPSPSPSQASPRSPLSMMQNMSISVRPPGPSGPGKAGERLKVLSNHFLVNCKDMPDLIYKSVIAISLSGSSRTVMGRVRRRVIELLLTQNTEFGHGVYSDFGGFLWSFKDLVSGQGASRVVNVDYFEAEELGPRTGTNRVLYQVQITSAFAPLPSAPLKALLSNPGAGTVIQRPVIDYEDALNHMILRYAAVHPDYETAARGTKIFPRKRNVPTTPAPPKRQALGGSLEAYRGYNRRAKITQGGIYVALVTTAGVMYAEGKASDLIMAWKKAHPTKSDLFLNAFVRGVRVRATWINRIKPIKRVLSNTNAQSAKFRCDTHPKSNAPLNQDVTVAWYFEQAYNIRIPASCLLLDVGSQDRECIWPADLCEVLPAQSYKDVLPLTEQAQEMIKFACRGPVENAKLITTEGQDMVGFKRANGNPGTIHGTPMKVLLHLATVPARRIGSPSLVFGNGTLSGRDTAKGQWNLASRRFLRSPTAQTKFTVIVLKRTKEPGIANLGAFVEGLVGGIQRYCGVKETATRVPGVDISLDWPAEGQVDWLKRLFVHCCKHGVKYCFIIASEKQWYVAIKEAADTVGMQTTVTLRKPGNTARSSPGEIANLMLKYSMKTLGVNWALSQPDLNNVLKKRTMFLGLDVVHPPPGALKLAPSVGGLVYSINPTPGQFLPNVFLMTPEAGKAAREIVPTATLKPAVEYALKGWQKNDGGNLPEVIWCCRDGVGDSQLDFVLQEELPAIKKAAKAVYGQRQLPEIFILTTTKRHVTRFFKSKDDRASDKLGAFDQKGNPLPGLIVDEQIVSRTRDDWYAVSHNCLQGTTRPAHHIRLYDELKLSKDQLQQLVHNLSFMYPRSVTSVSIPTPAKLADRLCDRAKTRMHDVYFPSEERRRRGDTWSIHNGGFLGQQSVHPDIRDTMYYI